MQMLVAIGQTLYAFARRLAWRGRFWRLLLWIVGDLTLRQGTPILTRVWCRIGLQRFINMRDVLFNLQHCQIRDARHKCKLGDLSGAGWLGEVPHWQDWAAMGLMAVAIVSVPWPRKVSALNAPALPPAGSSTGAPDREIRS